jgi:hypothetical protein
MSMDWQTFRGHALVVLATVSGIAGMGMVFDGAMHGSFIGMSRGMPFLLLGLWWAGRELGRSMIATGSRRGQAPDVRRGQAPGSRPSQARRNRRSPEQVSQTRGTTVNMSGQ